MKRNATILVLSLLVANPCWACDLVQAEDGHSGAATQPSHCADPEEEDASRTGCSDHAAPCLEKGGESLPGPTVAMEVPPAVTVSAGIGRLPDYEGRLTQREHRAARPERSTPPLYLKYSSYRI
jgi:hypothetical protein